MGACGQWCCFVSPPHTVLPGCFEPCPLESGRPFFAPPPPASSLSHVFVWPSCLFCKKNFLCHASHSFSTPLPPHLDLLEEGFPVFVPSACVVPSDLDSVKLCTFCSLGENPSCGLCQAGGQGEDWCSFSAVCFFCLVTAYS